MIDREKREDAEYGIPSFRNSIKGELEESPSNPKPFLPNCDV